MRITSEDLDLHAAPIARDFAECLTDVDGRPIHPGVHLIVDDGESLPLMSKSSLMDPHALGRGEFLIRFAPIVDEPETLHTPHFLRHPSVVQLFPELKGRRRDSFGVGEFLKLSVVAWLGRWYAGRWGFTPPYGTAGFARGLAPIGTGWPLTKAAERQVRVESAFVRRWLRRGLPRVLQVPTSLLPVRWPWAQ